ncbi:FAD/NAD(P)-binding domain-containing protein [Bordetella sputigena]|uniref:FAD-dependent oxidoreductase n=1 Tax=Bordetella sputigena TaxID=1416810 RepID=UPI0039F02231
MSPDKGLSSRNKGSPDHAGPGAGAAAGIDVLVVGAGPAGVGAAVEAARRGARVLLVEQRPHAGGAIHRAAHDGGPSAVPMPARHKRNWARLLRELDAFSARIRLLTSAVFLGIDGDGVCMIDSRADGPVKLVRARAIIYAIGATERAPHIPGWELPGVVTAGGLQVQMKESGQAPRGRILVAGNGPLPLALGAQLAALGNAPVAVLEAADPYRGLWRRPAAALGLAAGPKQLIEAAGYFRQLRPARVPYVTATTVSTVSRQDDGLRVRTVGPRGDARDYLVDLLVLHAGLACNDRGIPSGDVHGVIVAKAGDCNRVLGADAAPGEGRRVAAMVMARLDGAPSSPADRPLPWGIRAAAVFQASLRRLFASARPPMDMDTILCRCEGVTARDLTVRDLRSAREIRLVGRVGMGLCQGRYCAHAATMAADGDAGALTLADIDGPIPRWPIRPVSVKALADAQEL